MGTRSRRPNGDRSHQRAPRGAAERAASRRSVERIPHPVVPPTAAFYAMPKVALPPGATDFGSLLRATGVLCVYGSGSARVRGWLPRIVFLAPPQTRLDLPHRPLHGAFCPAGRTSGGGVG
jgi:aspartate/methionine/tyrosine aminotransferase